MVQELSAFRSQSICVVELRRRQVNEMTSFTCRRSTVVVGVRRNDRSEDRSRVSAHHRGVARLDEDAMTIGKGGIVPAVPG
jgi:hypothetical protein